MNARAPLTSQDDISLNSSEALICRIYKLKIPFRRGDRTNPSTVSLECKNQENASQRDRFMIGTKLPNHTRPHGFRVPGRYPNAH